MKKLLLITTLTAILPVAGALAQTAAQRIMELGTWCRDSARAQLSFQIRPGKAITKTRVQPACNMSIANTCAPIADCSVSRRYTGRKGGTADAPLSILESAAAGQACGS
jgi:hypothetical protein